MPAGYSQITLAAAAVPRPNDRCSSLQATRSRRCPGPSPRQPRCEEGDGWLLHSALVNALPRCKGGLAAQCACWARRARGSSGCCGAACSVPDTPPPSCAWLTTERRRGGCQEEAGQYRSRGLPGQSEHSALSGLCSKTLIRHGRAVQVRVVLPCRLGAAQPPCLTAQLRSQPESLLSPWPGPKSICILAVPLDCRWGGARCGRARGRRWRKERWSASWLRR